MAIAYQCLVGPVKDTYAACIGLLQHPNERLQCDSPHFVAQLTHMPLPLQHASTSKPWALSGDVAEDISPQAVTYKVEIFTGDVRGAGTHVSPLTGSLYDS